MLAVVLFVVGITQSAPVAAGSGLPAGFARVLKVSGLNQPTAYSGYPKNRVSRFTTVNGKGTTEEILLDAIQSDLGYHNGGDIQFGFDGKLYIAVGDGGLYWNGARALNVLSSKLMNMFIRLEKPVPHP